MAATKDLRLGQESRAVDGAQKLSVVYGASTEVGKFVTFKEATVTGTKVTRAITAAAKTDVIIGVSLVNKKPGAFMIGDTGHVLTNGVVWMTAHGAIKKGEKVGAFTDGTAMKSDGGTTDAVVNAYAMSSAADGELVEVKLNI